MSTKVKKTPFLKLAAAFVVAAFVFILGACPGVDSAADQTAASQGNGKYPGQNPNQRIALSDFEIKGLERSYTFDWEQKKVEVTHKAHKYTEDDITVFYKDINSDDDEETEAPRNAGNYEISFNVANIETLDVEGKPLVINKAIPEAKDFSITADEGIADRYSGVNITAGGNTSKGKITPFYEGRSGTPYPRSDIPPQIVGTFNVTFDVAEETLAPINFAAAKGLSKGTILTIREPSYYYIPPSEDHFKVIDDLDVVYDGTPKVVRVEPIDDSKSRGWIDVFYGNPRSPNPPTDAGWYDITFDIQEAPGWKAKTNLYAGTLYIREATPEPADFRFRGFFGRIYDRTPKAVTITPRAGKSTGTISIRYEGEDGKKYTTLNPPSAIGSYTVTFDVAAAKNYNARNNLSAGTLVIRAPAPVEDDFIYEGLTPTADGRQRHAVTITPKPGKSEGERTVWYTGIEPTVYARQETPPYKVGTYAVTFDVEEVPGHFSEAFGLKAGKLVISITGVPEADDYIFGGLEQYVGEPNAVTITPKDGKSKGKRTILYYDGDEEIAEPEEEGTYTVTFNVAAWRGFASANGLSAGTLTIKTRIPPEEDDYIIGGLGQIADGDSKTITITPKEGKSEGDRTVSYEGIPPTVYGPSTIGPQAVGDYKVTFNVAPWGDFGPATGLSAGTLVLSKQVIITYDPESTDFNFTGLGSHAWDGNAKTVTITPKEGKSGGKITVLYNGTPSDIGPSTRGTYTVTFNVDEAVGWNDANNLLAGTLTIADTVDYSSLLTGTSSQANVVHLVLTPGNDLTEIRLNWYSEYTSSTTTNGKVAKVMFVKGTFKEGEEEPLTETTTTALVGSAVTGNNPKIYHKATVTGLKPGNSYEYAVCSDGTNWSKTYKLEIPAANTTSFTFAATSDPQLSESMWDYNGKGRWSPPDDGTGSFKTVLAWKETVQKIKAAGASLIISSGDQADGSTEAQYKHLLAPLAPIPNEGKSLIYAPVSGNHDTTTTYNYHFNWPGQTGSASINSGRDYYYLYNNILFVALDTGMASSNSKAIWDKVLSDAKIEHAGKYDWLIVHHHRATNSPSTHNDDPTSTNPWGGGDTVPYIEAGFEKSMSDAGVDFVIGGHDHIYARSFPVQPGALTGTKYARGTAVTTSATGETLLAASGETWKNPGHPIYFTLTTASGIKYYPFSQWRTNAAYEQSYIPGYTIVNVDGRSITFKTYPTGSAPLDGYNEGTPHDVITVTKSGTR